MPSHDFQLCVNRLGSAPALSDVAFNLPSRSFTAVLGTSGSGKSILLALLAGRLDTDSFTFDGSVTNTGGENPSHTLHLTPRELQVLAAYVPPEDVVFGFDTPREAITFRHRLYYGSTAEEAEAAAATLLEEFGLTQCADNLIAPGVGLRGISGGQRRRTCIAMALATQPQLLLLDEPTTGLDSYTAKSVLAGLQRVARLHGCVVVAALQQPGSDLFQFMDRVVQLTDQGTCNFAGPPGDRPDSKPSTQLHALTDPSHAPDHFDDDQHPPADIRRASVAQQLALVMQRHLRALIRNPASLGMRVGQAIILAIFFGVVYFHTNLHPNNFKQILGFFITYVAVHFVPVQTGAAIFPMEKDVFLEEQALPFRYPAAVYALSKTLVESLVEIPLGVIFAVIIGFMVGFPSDVVGRLCVTSVLLTAATEAFGFFVSTVAPPAVSIAIVTPIVCFAMMIVGTALASPTGATKGLFDALKYLAFMRCGFAAIALDVLPLVSGTCTSGQCYYPSGHDAIVALDLDSTSQGREWGLLVMWFVVFRVGSAVALTVMGWDRRVAHEARERADASSETVALSIGVTTNSRSKVLYTVAPALRLSLQWSLRFRVKARFGIGSDSWRTILQPMEGIAHAGRCLAVMGGSGAGKSTLLEALTLQLPASGWYTLTDRRCRVEVVDEATQTIFGAPLGARARALLSVVYQDPLFISGLTVCEVLEFAASIHGCDSDIVEALLDIMNLTHVRNLQASTLSVSQKKRLAVCEALAMRRPIVLLDEPTSGLDAEAARQLLSLLHELAHEHGVTVLYTLHQPGDDLLPYIDDLLLLSQGNVVYHGPLEDASTHFSSYEKPEGLNETDHYLELASSPDIAGDLLSAWREAHPTQRMTEAMLSETNEWTRAVLGDEFGLRDAEAAVLRPFQGLRHSLSGFMALVRRGFNVSVQKVPVWNLALRFFTLYVLVPLIAGISQYKLASNIVMLQNGIFMVGFSLSFTTTLIPLLDVSLDLPVYLRDQTADKYSSLAYFLARTVAGLPLEVVGVMVSALISYFMMGMSNDAGSFFLYFVVLLLIGHACTGVGFVLSITIPSLVVSSALATMLQIVCATGAGVLIAPSSVDSTGWLHTTEFVSPLRQGVLAVLHDQLRSTAGGEALLAQTLEFNRSFDGVTAVWIMLVGLMVVYHCSAGLAFWTFSRPASY